MPFVAGCDLVSVLLLAWVAFAWLAAAWAPWLATSGLVAALAPWLATAGTREGENVIALVSLAMPK